MMFRALTASPWSVVPWTCKKQIVSCLHLAPDSFPGEKKDKIINFDSILFLKFDENVL